MSAALKREVLASTLSAYRRLCKTCDEGLDLPPLELVALIAKRYTPEAKGAGIKDFNLQAHEGFCRYQSGLTWSDGRAYEAAFGQPVFAEWRESDAVSHRLRVAGGVTTVWTLTERLLDADGDLAPGETPFLRRRKTIGAHETLTPHVYLAYHVYFGAGDGADPHALRQVCDRFFGFSNEEFS